MLPNHVPLRVHVLAKPSGPACNLACSYCFFLDKQLLYPNSNLRMTEETLEVYIRELIAAHRSSEVTVAWQGGEPTLMGIDFFRKAIQFQEKYRRPGMHFENTLLCLKCPVLFACHGECPKNRFIKTPDGQPGLNYLCAGYRAFFKRADEPMKILAMLMHTGRPASDVMNILSARKEELANAFHHANLDRPCPCASGLTFQECHGWSHSSHSRKSRNKSIGGPRPSVHTIGS
jgi:sulfatase maturation enzyme AslB (radical SAM superfamily)